MFACKRYPMAKQIRYNKLWKILVDRKLSKADLRRAIGAAPNTLTKLRRDEEVSMSVLIRICEYLDCDIGDVVSLVDVPATACSATAADVAVITEAAAAEP